MRLISELSQLHTVAQDRHAQEVVLNKLERRFRDHGDRASLEAVQRIKLVLGIEGEGE